MINSQSNQTNEADNNFIIKKILPQKSLNRKSSLNLYSNYFFKDKECTIASSLTSYHKSKGIESSDVENKR